LSTPPPGLGSERAQLGWVTMCLGRTTKNSARGCIFPPIQANCRVFPLRVLRMKIRVLHHNHCFDGAAAAAFFTRFVEGAFHPGAEFHYTGMAHTAAQHFDDSLFDGDENAIVDFKYSSNPRLTWWFDHHQSAFLSEEDAEHWRRDTSGKKLFDPSFRSCTAFIAHVARTRFGWESPDLAELVEAADIIDGAQYADAKSAVELGTPAMKLTLVIEGVKGSQTVHQIIRWMCHRKLADIIAEPEIQSVYQPLYERHLRSIELIRDRGVCEDGVVFFDLADLGEEAYNKFIPYYLHPEATYTVSVSTSSFRTKVSVGTNPWTKDQSLRNLASICERYGGGGHPRVGAISFPKGDVKSARRVAAEIVAELRKR